MKKDTSIKIKINKGQYLTEVLPLIPTNTILNKTLTGLGATYGEIESDRHSIIIEPNVPVIVGKKKDPKHKNIFGVYEGIYADDVLDYLEKGKNKYNYKILTTPESFHKIKDAISEFGMNIYEDFFLLFDECEKIVQDVCYRQDIALPIDDFFKFENKAFVSATPIVPSDPRFEEQDFWIIEIEPTFDYKKNMHLITTNNVLEALRQGLDKLSQYNKENNDEKNVCIFLNSTDTIEAIIKQLDIKKESSVFCSKKSVKKLKNRDFKSVYEHWNKEHIKKYNFFTSRFYSALDIELDESIDLFMISDLYYAEHSMIDPNTEALQIIGRFRKENGVAEIIHITNIKKDLPVRSKIELQSYLDCSESIYNKISELYDTATDFNYKQAFKEALSVIPYSKYIDKEGRKNYFALDNYIDEEIIKSYYKNQNLLLKAYESSNRFTVKHEKPYFPLGDYERLQRERDNKSIKERNIETVRQLSLLMESGDYQSTIIQECRDELFKYNKFIVEAFELLGKDKIEELKYSRPKIREAIILEEYKNGTSKTGFQDMLDNSFRIGKKYTRKFIKEELIRIYREFNVKPKEAITAETIRNYFDVVPAKIKGDLAFYIIARL